MSAPQDRRKQQIRQARLEIVSELYKRGYSLRKITEEVKRRLNIPKLAVSTTYNDVQTLLKEWRESRIENIDQALQLELERIDDTTAELWEQWDKSKTETQKTTTTRSGRIKGKGNAGIETDAVSESRTKVGGLGNPAYIAEIRQQLIERRKLLGLYAPEARHVKSEVTVHRPPCEMTTEELEAELKALRLM
nr:MAG TPA: Putative regulatory protein transcriptional regulator family, HTH-Motif [Caudoviricetes sp.]